jgi:heat shock protein HslJ
MALGGTYAYIADAASFVECLTGREYPVLLEGDHLRLEREYLAQRSKPGERMGARFQGRFSLREPEPGAPPREYVVVERFVALSPNETCPGTVSLEGTHWRALEIDGEQVARAPGQRPPSLVIGRGRVSGFGGCNRFAGAFDPRGVLFREVVSTRMACPDPAGEVETRFLRALEAATTLTIMGTGLELRDAQNTVRMRLEATAELR